MAKKNPTSIPEMRRVFTSFFDLAEGLEDETRQDAIQCLNDLLDVFAEDGLFGNSGEADPRGNPNEK